MAGVNLLTKSEELRVAWAQSFGWIILLIAGVVEIAVLTIFIHGTPHGRDADAATMMVFISLILGVASVIGAFLTFALPQFFQALISDVLVRAFGRPGQFGILAALPMTAILSWYCWDYLVPSFQLGINEGADWAPYQHGLTLTRYLTMLAVQTPVTLFSLAYCDAAIRQGSRKPAVRLALALAIVAGVAFGVWRVTGQHQVLKPEKSDRLAWRGAQGG
jgi:hypothetical protein